MRLRTLLMTLAFTLALAAPAMARGGNAGEGWAGETDDKVVTFASLGVLLFFVFVVVFGSLVQGRLDKRKDEKKAAQKLQRVGW